MPCFGKPANAVTIERGSPLMLGMHEVHDGFNFAVFSRHATRVSLLLFEVSGPEPFQTVDLDPVHHRTGDIWHIRLRGDLVGKAYALRVDGPSDPHSGSLFDPRVLLLDPYATAVVPPPPGASIEPSAPFPPRALIVEQGFDWGDHPFRRRPWRDTIIYETHVRGLTVHPSSGVTHPGQYLGLIEKIPYLQALGITAVELMPVQEFRDTEPRPGDPSGPKVRNYWGYNPVALFAPKASYATGSPQAAIVEFKTMVRELHNAGIEVILDVVFNHTAEGDQSGPTISFRGLDNAIYYILTPDMQRYVDFTGCGNTLNCNHPVVRSFIIDCLRHWTVHMRVDGFRFDLASILGRDSEGNLLPNPPLLEQIAEDPILRDIKLIAETWDLGGAFQVGTFPGQRWAEWNSRYRDDVRRFWRGDTGMAGAFATRICGSADLYQRAGETPINSINFVTSHDGFTLNDLVSYGRKHNEANGQGNADGVAENFSANYGTEGPTDDPAVEAVRLRQIKNMLVTLFISRGVPMLLGGDEFRRTQAGNNNAYCQDNDISWYDWELGTRHADLVRFVRGLAMLRMRHSVLAAERFYTDGEVSWFGSGGMTPAWNGPDNQLGCLIRKGDDGRSNGVLCMLFNATSRPCAFDLSRQSVEPWLIAVDTAAAPPADITDPGEERLLSAPSVPLAAHSTVILVSHRYRSSY
ncbi:glycogen debranching protein GlgX [Microvirga sp. M2]|uniref:glycogen debranching protein GlgX n=1 Tax=Microvirga sp. M2 TaxID=3073270 RepID=UPI0039C212BC